MATTYVKMDSKRIEAVAGKDNDYKAEKLSAFVIAELVKTFQDKKKFAAEIPPDSLTMLLKDAVGKKIKEAVKLMAKPVTSVEVYTDSSVLSKGSKLHMKYKANSKEGKAEVLSDWKALKADVKAIAKELADEPAEKLTSVQSLKHPNIYPLVEAELTPEAKLNFKGTTIPIDVVINDKETVDFLSKQRANRLLLQKASDSAGFATIVSDVAAAFNKAAAMANKDPGKIEQAKALVNTAVPKAIEDAVERVMETVGNSAKIRLDRKKYFLKTGWKIAMNFVTMATTSARLAASHGGDIMAWLDLIKAVVDTSQLIFNLAAGVKAVGLKYKATMVAVETLYVNVAKENAQAIGVIESANRVANQWLPNVFPSIKKAREDADAWEHNINGVEVKSESLSKNIDGAITKVNKIDNAILLLKPLMDDPRYKKALPGMVNNSTKAKTTVTKLFDKVTLCHQKVVKLRADFESSTELLIKLEGLTPKWVVIVEVCTSIGKACTSIDSSLQAMNTIGETALSMVEIGSTMIGYAEAIKDGMEEIDKN